MVNSVAAACMWCVTFDDLEGVEKPEMFDPQAVDSACVSRLKAQFDEGTLAIDSSTLLVRSTTMLQVSV